MSHHNAERHYKLKSKIMKKAIVINEKGAYAHMNGQSVEINTEQLYQDLAVDRVVLIG